MENLKLGRFYCLQLSPDDDNNVKPGKIFDEHAGISKTNVSSAIPDFHSGSDFERYGKCFISRPNTR